MMQNTDPLVLKLKAGWSFEGQGLAFVHSGRRLWLQVPSGTQLASAPAGYMHLRLDAGVSVREVTALARDWPCVERVDEPQAA